MDSVTAASSDSTSVDGEPPKRRPRDEDPEPLRVAVVGAGIGGLCAAIGLRRNGHEVDVCIF